MPITSNFFLFPRKILALDLDIYCKAVLTALVQHYPNPIFPSHKTIAADASCSIATVKVKLDELRAKGFVDWIPHPEKASNLYTLNLDLLDCQGESTKSKRRSKTRSEASELRSPIHRDDSGITDSNEDTSAIPLADPSLQDWENHINQ